MLRNTEDKRRRLYVKEHRSQFVSYYFPTNFPNVPMAAICYSRPILINLIRNSKLIKKCLKFEIQN